MRWWPLLLVLAGCDLVFQVKTPGEPDEATFVQAFARDTKLGTAVEVPYLNPTLPGSLLVVGVDWTAIDVDLASIEDTLGDALVPASPVIEQGFLHAQLFYAVNVAGGPCTVRVTLTGMADSLEVYVHEYAGIATDDPFDNVSVNVGDSGGTVGSGTATFDSSGELLFAYAVDGHVDPGEGFTARSTFNENLTQDRLGGPPGPYNATVTTNSGFTLIFAGFRAATTD